MVIGAGVWLLWIAIALILGLTVSVLLYLLSKFFNSTELGFKAKGYFGDMLSTALIVFVILLFIGELGTLGRMLSISHMVLSNSKDLEPYWGELGSPPGQLPLPGNAIGIYIFADKVSNGYYGSEIQQKTDVHMYAMYLVKDTAKLMANIYKLGNTVYFVINTMAHTSIITSGSEPAGYFAKGIPNSFVQFMEFFIDKLDTAIFAQYMLLEIMSYGVFIASFLLPMGIILRMFAPTRGTGAMLIAFGLGIGYVFHISYVFLYITFETFSPTDPLVAMVKDLARSEDFVKVKWLLEEVTADCRIDSRDIPVIMGLYGNVLKFALRYMKVVIRGTLISLVYRSLIIPVILLTILYTFIRSSAMLLGADLTEIARGLAKVI